ncbi:MAG: DNA topoisomerase, partial [Casimicrobiaceae bacterium]
KALTYPRTDSRALPEDYLGTVTATLGALAETTYAAFARRILDSRWVHPNRRIFDNAKISDHFAIIPTLVHPKHLSEAEAKLYDLVVKRFLAVFHPAAEYQVTTRITRVGDHPFKSEGKVLVQPGWLAVYGREAQGDEALLTPVRTGEVVATTKVDVAALATRPPPRYNEATLLSAMEGAGKSIEDEELREAMREKGLGTPATRAQIIEGLIAERYVLREGRELIPTPKAFSLMTLLHGLGVPELFSPELTAEWEFKLAQMERGRLARKDFMDEIVAMTRRIVAQAKNYESDTIPGDFATLVARCPKCGNEVHEKYRKFQCVQCDFGFWKIMGGRQLSPAEAETLLTTREVGPLDGFRSRLGRPFSAKLRLTQTHEVEFDFGPRADDDTANPPDFSGQEPLGPCPKCGHRVFETTNAYVCERAVGPERSCDFRSGRTILQRVVERAQMTKLLETGKSDLLQFVSARTRRPFAAFLVRQADGKIGFEFAPREGGRASRAGARVPLRVLGRHPRDGQPVELHAGRYGPYVKHGVLNATLSDKAGADALTLEQAVELLDQRAEREGGSRAPRRTARTAASGAARPATRAAPRTAPSRGPRTHRRTTPKVAALESASGAAKPKATAATSKAAAAKSKAAAVKSKAAAVKSKATAAKPASRAIKPRVAGATPKSTAAGPKPAAAPTKPAAAKRKPARG